MKIQWKPLAVSLAVPLAVGALSAFLTRGSMKAFESLNQPPLSPPGWLFPIVWTVLFILMGIASYLVYTSGRSHRARRSALDLYSAQLIANFFWPVLFFNMLIPYLLWVTFAGYLNLGVYLLN